LQIVKIDGVTIDGVGAENKSLLSWAYIFNWPICEYGEALIESGEYVAYSAQKQYTSSQASRAFATRGPSNIEQ